MAHRAYFTAHYLDLRLVDIFTAHYLKLKPADFVIFYIFNELFDFNSSDSISKALFLASLKRPL